MNENLMKEINYLTRLIELHQQKHPGRLVHNMKACESQELSLGKSDKRANLILRLPSSVSTSIADSYRSEPTKCQKNTNVHINPNFKPHNPIIHINPKVRLKPLVHVNPKMIDAASSNKDVEVKHVTPATNAKYNVTQTDIKRSVYVNPKLMKRLSSMTESKSADNKQTTIQGSADSVCSRLKFVKSTNSPKVNQKKGNNSNVVILSRRKLIRVRRGTKGPLNTSQIGLHKIKKPLTLPFNKSKINTSKIIKTKLTNMVQQSAIQNYSLVKLPAVKPKVNKYRIDRTILENARTKKRAPSSSKTIMNNMTELITIGGIVYKSSKNQLVRRSYGLKKKRATNAKIDKFVIATNGKKLCRIKCTKEMELNTDTAMRNESSHIKSLSNVSQKVNYKNNISNKVKQRSIQILRNKMRKNNQPCLIFQRFGFCANHEKGTCSKLHDKKQISLCKKFLQGNCLLDKCPLSHDVGPEKMPTCKYFLDGCCMRDACPYRHIKVSSNTPICIEFLKGYCAKGHECKRRHENLCPEFTKAGRCSKGKYCPYPHKLQSTALKQTDKYLNRKHDVPIEQTALATNSSGTNHDNRVRYYEQTDTLNEDFEKKKESIMRKIQIMKHIETVAQCNEIISSESSCEVNDTCPLKTIKRNAEPQVAFENNVPQRPPIGALPAYIPID